MLAPVQKCLILRAHTYSNETLAYHVQAITSQDVIQEMMKFVIKNREINEKSRGRLMDALMNENTRREVARSRSQPSTVAQERQPFISCEAVNAKYCRPKKGIKASKGRHSRLEDDLYKKIMKFLEKSGYYDIDSARFTKTFTAIMSEAKKDELLEDCGYTSNLQEGRDKIHKYLESLRVRMRDNPTSFRSDYNKIFGRDPSPLQSDSTEDDGQSKKLSQHLARGTKAHLLIPHESEDNLKHFYKLGICISDCPGGDQCSCNDNTRVFITELHPDPFQEGNKIFMEHHVNNITPPNIPALKRYVQWPRHLLTTVLKTSEEQHLDLLKQCQERSEKIRRGYEAFKSTTTRYSLEDKLTLLRNYAKQYREEHNLPEDAPVPRPSKNHSFLFKFIQYQISDANGKHNARGNQKVQERALELLTSKVREILCQPETYWWTGKSLNQVGRKNISDKNHKTSNKTENNVREAQKEQIDPQPQKKSSRGRAIVARKDETFAYFPLKRSYKAIKKDLESTGAKKVRCEATKVSDSEGDDSTRPTVGQQELYGGLEVLAEVN